MSRRILLTLILVLVTLPAGCIFGGEMTAEKLEDKLDNEWDRSLEKFEDVDCREGTGWDFECAYTLEMGLTGSATAEMAMAFMVDGDELTCTSGPQTRAEGLPPPEMCEQLAR